MWKNITTARLRVQPLGSRLFRPSLHHFPQIVLLGKNYSTEQFENSSRIEAMVTCLPGLEDILSAELSSLGMAHEVKSHGATFIQPTLASLHAGCLHLGSATNILIRCTEPFFAHSLSTIRRITAKLPWNDILSSSHVRVKVKVKSIKSKLYHSAAVEARVVAGIYDSLGYSIPARQTTVEYPAEILSDDPTVLLQVNIVKDKVEIWIYASDTPLYRRGYRLEMCKAPLREDLAYAMLYGAGWRPLVEENRAHDILFDPLCGSGTIAIEGAAIAAGLAPGRLRLPPWSGTAFENNQFYQQLVDKAVASACTSVSVFASDRDAGAIAATTANAERAGLLHCIDIQQGALKAHSIWTKESDQRLLVATNPPFGKRVSNSSTRGTCAPLLPLYQTLQRLTAGRANTSSIILSQGVELVRRSGWPMNKVFQSTHGGLPVTAISSEDCSKDPADREDLALDS